MGTAVNFKLLWFLTLTLLTQGHIINKRQADKDYSSQSLESLTPVKELLIKARQALNNDFNDLASPPYDDVNLKHKVKLSEITANKDFPISIKNEGKVQKNSENFYMENQEKLLKIGNSESEETILPNSEKSVKTSTAAENHLIKADLSFEKENIEASSNKEFSENEGILAAQPVTIKPSENFFKIDNQYTESTADNNNVNKIQILAIKNSENSSSDFENKIDMKTQKEKLEASNTGNKNSVSYKAIKDKNTLENQSQAVNNSEKETIYLNTTKDKHAEQKLNENGLENSVTKPVALKQPSEVIELESTTERLPLYTPIAVTTLPSVVIKKKPMSGNSTKPPLPKPNTTAIPPKPLALGSAANADKTTGIFSSTTPTVASDAKATEKPITMSAIRPTRRPLLPFPGRRPTPQKQRPPVGLRPPAWLTNLPLLPLNPLLPNFFINPFNTSNTPTNNFGFGILAIPWSWRPFNNVTNFFLPSRIVETRPSLQDESVSSTETRDLAFWNALFHRDYKAPGNAIYKDTSEADKTTENGNDSYWKPWKFLKFFSDNGDTNDVATVPANTQILHVYFPLKYPFKGKIVQTPAYQMAEQNPANNEEVLEKDDLYPAEEPVKERALDATAHKNGDTEDMASKKKDDQKSSLMFELAMPKPVVQLFQGFMETFMPQQN